MSFENISKGEFERSGWKVVNEQDDDLISCHGRKYEENAEFIAFCFNLQQRFDIGCYEKVIELMEDIERAVDNGFELAPDSPNHNKLKEILNKAKK